MNTLEKAWQSRGFVACLLWPVSMVFRALVGLRTAVFNVTNRAKRSALAAALTPALAPTPVIVVGNLSVGGTGKSPLTAALVAYFQSMDWKPGIVSRGYGGNAIDTPQRVTAESNPADVGDEPVMLARETGVPVCVCRRRRQAVAALVADGSVDLVISDDGLQHYAMDRDVEIVVVDETKGFANGWMLPAGPLREPLARLNRVDLIALHTAAFGRTSSAKQPGSIPLPQDVNAGCFYLKQTRLVQRWPENNSETVYDLAHLAGKTVNAVAGIGNPQRFFDQCQQAGMHVLPNPKPDHHEWTITDLIMPNEHPIVMTSKDAVKVRSLLNVETIDRANDTPINFAPIYEIRVQAVLNADLQKALSIIEQQLHTSYRQPKRLS